MMTKPHNDRTVRDGIDHGYSIRVGNVVPPDSANLAYVSSPDMDPKQNLLITDVSDQIRENRLKNEYELEHALYPDSQFALRELNGNSTFSTKNVLLTDEFSVPANTQDIPQPLYYKAETKGLFDGRLSTVAYYEGGYQGRPVDLPMDYSQVDQALVDEGKDLIYLGNKIRITNLDGSQILQSNRYKIILVKQSGTEVPKDAYKAVIYTNFRGSADRTYVVRYEKYNNDGTHVQDCVEILNAYPFFTQVDKQVIDSLAAAPKNADGSWKTGLNNKQFSMVETADHRYQLYAPSQVLVADTAVRPSHQFRYRIQGNLTTKFTPDNKGTLKIGIAYMNNTVPSVQDLSGVIKRLHEHPLKPEYLDFENPWPKVSDKKNPNYWAIDLTMPADHLNAYDLIVVTGYGPFDMSTYSDSFRQYLKHGGRVWVDNAGTGANVFQLNNFLVNIGFSQTESSSGPKTITTVDEAAKYSSRLYVIDQNNFSIGDAATNPKIVLGDGESQSDWSDLVQYSTDDPAIMYKRMFEKGLVIVSNCGIFKALHSSEGQDLKFVMNGILSYAEEKWTHTPWHQDYVHHRDNLFPDEYRNGGTQVYVDDRSDIDQSQIVAKKIINKTVRDALVPYMPAYYYQAKGKFSMDIVSDLPIFTPNSDFEVGKADAFGNAVTSWTVNTTGAIPSWDTRVVGVGATFSHVVSTSDRGTKAVKIDVPTGTMGSKAYWSTTVAQLISGSYRLKGWVKVQNVAGFSTSGATAAVYDAAGNLIATSQPVVGTRDWIELDFTFSLSATMDIEIRLGFVDGNGIGIVMFDEIEIYSTGSVYATPENDGSAPLYAYSARPRADVFDLKSQGFSSTDVTVYDPPITLTYTIQAYVYQWDNSVQRFVRANGNFKTYTTTIRRSDGLVNLGALSTLTPPLEAGGAWADKSKVYYEISLGASNGAGWASQYANIRFFNTGTGQYYFSESGENAIQYSILFDQAKKPQIIVQAWTDYYTIRATKRRYSMLVRDSERIFLQYPSTIDDRESWFLRVHNGSFTKRSLSRSEHIEYGNYYMNSSSPGIAAPMTRQFGTHFYELPEYDRQLYKPGKPYRKVSKELCEYLNETTVRLQNTPLYVSQGQARGEVLTPAVTGNTKVFLAMNKNWDESVVPNIYLDEAGNGSWTLTFAYKYNIDYSNGAVVFDNPLLTTAAVKADYDFNNLHVMKQSFANARVARELLQTSDKETFASKNQNWLLYPNPTIYRLPQGQEDQTMFVADVSTYTINYDKGAVVFKEETSDRVYADYSYSETKDLKIKDYDIQAGIIHLDESNPITFKDEVYASYFYEEKFVEYRGYYDETILGGKFMHLDLNPSEGHYCTLPIVRYDGPTPIITYENTPTAKLMNKEIYVYAVPHRDSFGNTTDHTIRHCFSKKEWNKIRFTTPTALLLGIIQLREHTTVDKVTVMDTRVRGGGLKKGITKEQIKKVDPTSTSYWDVATWDGMAYYSNGVIVIQVPRTVLKTEGGQFTEKEVTDIVRKYIGYGIYYIVEYA